MKIALYIDDGVEQIALTPETETERTILTLLHDGERDIAIRRGSFYECRGGWVRHGQMAGLHDHGSIRDLDSTMLVMRRRAPGQERG